MLISIDHGNKQIKTKRKIFTSGLIESDTRPPFGREILQYEGKYYALSDKRIPYMRHKYQDKSFFVLTLYAIAHELNIANQYNADEVIHIKLAVGLPPSHYREQCLQFENYFTNRDIIYFSIDGKPYSIFIDEAVAYVQAYAAAMTVFPQIRNLSKLIVLDIGGHTADYLLIKNGQADLQAYDSLEHGTSFLYNDVIKKVNADYDILLDESDIDNIIKGKSINFPQTVSDIIHSKSEMFINNLIGLLRERMIDLRFGETLFVGGGSILLRKYIESCEKIGHCVFIEDIAANAKGYELLYLADKRQ